MAISSRRFSGGALAARQARRAVREELEGELAEPVLGDVELLVSELATNSVRHAGIGRVRRVDRDRDPGPARARGGLGRRRRLRGRRAHGAARAARPAATACCCSSACPTAGACGATAASASGSSSRSRPAEHRYRLRADDRRRPSAPSRSSSASCARARRSTSSAAGCTAGRSSLLGAVVTLAGIAMLALPGPAFVVIPIGLAILSLEFEWAERLLEKALSRARRRGARPRRPRRPQKRADGRRRRAGRGGGRRGLSALGHPVRPGLARCGSLPDHSASRIIRGPAGYDRS